MTKSEIGGAVRKKNMPRCLLVFLLRAVHWCLRKRKGKDGGEGCACDLILLFSLLLVIPYFFFSSVKPTPGGRLALFKNTGLVPQGGGAFYILGSCLCAAAFDCLSERRGGREMEMGERSGGEREKRTRQCLISGVLSHTGM